MLHYIMHATSIKDIIQTTLQYSTFSYYTKEISEIHGSISLHYLHAVIMLISCCVKIVAWFC